MTLQRFDHAGAAPQTTLSIAIGAADPSLTAASGTGYPTGGVGPFVIVIDPGLAGEEKILCSSRSGAVFTVASSGRGYDNTVASSHSSGASIQHVYSAAEADDSNAHVYTTTRDDHTQYSKTDGTRAFTGGVTVNAGGAAITGLVAITGTLTVSGAGTGSSSITGLDLVATGLTGATAASRYVGATASGAPVSGTFQIGDFIIDQTGLIWICTAGGTPGTWAKLAADSGLVHLAGAETITGGKTFNAQLVGNSSITAVDFVATGLTGAATVSRYVGATAAGPPTTGTFQVGDFVIDGSGGMWICTAPGTPGTWAGGYARNAVTADVTTAESTSSASYTDLTTVGPTATNVPMQAGQQAEVTVQCVTWANSPNQFSGMGFAVSGADTLAASDVNAALWKLTINQADAPMGRTTLYTASTAGNHTFTAKYKSSANTTQFYNRRIIVRTL